MPIRDTSLDRYLGELRTSADAVGEHVLEVRNSAEYAEALHDRDAYEVIGDLHLLETVEANVRAVAEADLPLTPQRITRALDRAGFEEVDYLRSLTGDTTDDGRTRHPGHWADDTGLLANAYEHEVNP